MRLLKLIPILSLLTPVFLAFPDAARRLPKVEQVELQPLAAQVRRLVEVMDYLGSPINAADKQALERAGGETDAGRARREIQDVLDRYCLLDVHINPESRVKVAQGPAKAELVEHGWRTYLVKVRNEAGVTAKLVGRSPEAKPAYVPGSPPVAPNARQGGQRSDPNRKDEVPR